MDQIYCAGRYRVATIAVEMKMSHWVEAPTVTRVEDGTVVLDLADDLWDLQTVQEEGAVLALVLRKYPGLTNDVKVRILPESDSFLIGGRTMTRAELIAVLSEFA